MRYKKIYSLFAVLFLCLNVFAKNAGADDYAKESVLSSGNWYQMKVDSNGIYKLTYDEIKKYISDPAKVKIYGYGGWILDENFSKPYTDDLPEVSVYINKGSDGVFNSGDYLLFYGRGTVKWTYNSGSDVFEHENNPYATYGSYFLTEGETGPKEMKTIPSASNADVTLSVFDDYALHEKDLITIANTGRELFGESFLNQSGRQTFSFSVPGITSDLGKVQYSFAAAPKTNTSLEVSAGDTSWVNAVSAMGSDQYVKAKLVENWRNWSGAKTSPVKVTIAYNASGTFANLNFIVLNVKRTLQFYNTSFTFFRNKESRSRNVRYHIGNAGASSMVWDITGNEDAQLVQTALDGSQLSFATQADATLHEYAMVNASGSFPTPQIGKEKVANQNLHALPQADMVILSPAVYLKQAEKLAEKHRTKSNLKVVVVEEKQVFNEFSSGTPDATAYRRLMKMFYDRAAGEQEKPRYLLFFGDGVFDNRHLTSAMAKLDTKYYLLTYQMKESVNEGGSYGSDDYFGLLEDKSGTSLTANLCLGIGRFPVSSVTQAEDAVNKVIAYMDNTQGGNWKSKLVFTADDLDRDTPHSFNDSGSSHVYQADFLSRYMDETYPEYILYKYFMDVYQPVVVNGKTTYPDAKKAFLNTLNNGCFLVNYTGHGSTTSWSAEDMLKITDIRQMNFQNLPVWITATCDFGWFDGINTSAGEEAFLNKKSGAIALYTTSRVVYSSENFAINKKLVQYLFTTDPSGKHLRLGDVLRKSKNDLTGANKLNYVLLGDPALELNYPVMNVQVETINGETVTDATKFAFKALEKITVTGSIVDENGAKADGFSGELNASIFDSKQVTKSYRPDAGGEYLSFTSYPNMIYQAKTTVANGSFAFSFMVPLDISYTVDEPASYENKNGKMNFYATSSGVSKQDAYGSFSNYILSGTGDVTLDRTGPEIREMYLNTSAFEDGDKVNETPYFHARVFDETGINISGSGLGHDLLICIDGKPAWTYYQSQHSFDLTNVDDDWIIGFSIPELPAGEHILSFKVWDIMNNPSVDSLRFNVIKGYKPVIVDLQATDNPAKTGTTFVLNHNLPQTPLNMEVRVYDLSGRIVWSSSQKTTSIFPACSVDWDLRSSSGNRVQPGVYIYWATVRTENSKEVTKAKKIVVLEQ
ncbi:peptidase C25 [Bacteroidia bacterium]|nr:peptidase C25 [Bacteroidia bacterium]